MGEGHKIAESRTVRLFKNGRSQAVRIPKDWEFEGDDVTISRIGDAGLIIEPTPARRTPRQIVEWLRRQPPMEKDFADHDDGDMLPLDDINI